MTKDDIKTCCEIWIETLEKFGIKGRITQFEELQIARAIQKWGFDTIELALYGARFEPKTDRFNPSDYISIRRLFGKDKDGNERLDSYINWGRKGRTQEERELEKQKKRQEEDQEYEQCDPEKVRAIISNAFKR